jgi:hypothetical protein
MELKRCFPRSEVKLRDAGEICRVTTLQRRSESGGFGPVGKCAKSRQHNANASPGVPFGSGSALKIRVVEPGLQPGFFVSRVAG